MRKWGASTNVEVFRYTSSKLSKVNKLRAENDMTKLDFKKRSCLRCDKQFLSAGPQNRLCYNCGGQSEPA